MPSSMTYMLKFPTTGIETISPEVHFTVDSLHGGELDLMTVRFMDPYDPTNSERMVIVPKETYASVVDTVAGKGWEGRMRLHRGDGDPNGFIFLQNQLAVNVRVRDARVIWDYYVRNGWVRGTFGKVLTP